MRVVGPRQVKHPFLRDRFERYGKMRQARPAAGGRLPFYPGVINMGPGPMGPGRWGSYLWRPAEGDAAILRCHWRSFLVNICHSTVIF
jgi:hypothetical protein